MPICKLFAHSVPVIQFYVVLTVLFSLWTQNVEYWNISIGSIYFPKWLWGAILFPQNF